MTEEEKAKRRFFMSEDARTVFIPPCAVCKNVDGLNCKALKGRRPENIIWMIILIFRNVLNSILIQMRFMQTNIRNYQSIIIGKHPHIDCGCFSYAQI